ncbi:hypothetical protein [Nostoc sp. 2RC]|uniref:hypothetical protein n=1 Tax=Nostoc sp. 2RC TaxID=2485484 RepID=UPI0016270391|nr:hypothetical protein [Nostoc sp. 2RC]MBC1237570.1 hypothetical protein [Nostoc sp. 2RC]
MRIYDSTLLSRHKVYEIKGTFYRFLWKEDNIQYIQHPQYKFRPLAGQRKKADLVIGHKKLTSTCYEVKGATIHSYIHKEYIQLSIFDLL